VFQEIFCERGKGSRNVRCALACVAAIATKQRVRTEALVSSNQGNAQRLSSPAAR